MPTRLIENILVIDEIPLIAVGLQEVFRTIRPSIRTDYAESAYTVLSASKYLGRSYDLIILGTGQDRPAETLLHLTTDLRHRFPQDLLYIFSDQYYPSMIEKMEEGLIHAFVHKHESVEEIRDSYTNLAEGKTFLSSTFLTLYQTYRLYR